MVAFNSNNHCSYNKLIKMKTMIFPILAIAFLQDVNGQTAVEKVPEKVLNSFSAKFPDAKVRNWKIEDNDYVAGFIFDHNKSSAFYSADDSWLKTETKVRWMKNLPDAVKKSFYQSEYATWAIDEIGHIQTPDQHVYTILVNDGNLLDSDHYDVFKQNVMLYYSPQGQLERKINKR
jgi:hypothetical protein